MGWVLAQPGNTPQGVRSHPAPPPTPDHLPPTYLLPLTTHQTEPNRVEVVGHGSGGLPQCLAAAAASEARLLCFRTLYSTKRVALTLPPSWRQPRDETSHRRWTSCNTEHVLIPGAALLGRAEGRRGGCAPRRRQPAAQVHLLHARWARGARAHPHSRPARHGCNRRGAAGKRDGSGAVVAQLTTTSLYLTSSLFYGAALTVVPLCITYYGRRRTCGWRWRPWRSLARRPSCRACCRRV